MPARRSTSGRLWLVFLACSCLLSPALQITSNSKDQQQLKLEQRLSSASSAASKDKKSSVRICDFADCNSCADYIHCHWCPHHGKEKEGICHTTFSIFGCTVSGGVFNRASCPAAQAKVRGCTDPKADNYFPKAQVDDGACRYPQKVVPVVKGCTDNVALNYVMAATEDDPTKPCIYNGTSAITHRSVHNKVTDPKTCGSKVGNMKYSDQCKCGPSGMMNEYGRFCGRGYTGCRGSQPCDELDLCCQRHDWCCSQGDGAMESCECNKEFMDCVFNVTGPGFCGMQPKARNNVLVQVIPYATAGACGVVEGIAGKVLKKQEGAPAASAGSTGNTTTAATTTTTTNSSNDFVAAVDAGAAEATSNASTADKAAQTQGIEDAQQKKGPMGP